MDKLTGMEKLKDFFPENHIKFKVLDDSEISEIKKELEYWSEKNNPFALRTAEKGIGAGSPHLLNIKEVDKALDWIEKEVDLEKCKLILSQYINNLILNGIITADDNKITGEIIPRDLEDLAGGKYKPTEDERIYISEGLIHLPKGYALLTKKGIKRLLENAPNGIYEFGVGEVTGRQGIYFYEYRERYKEDS